MGTTGSSFSATFQDFHTTFSTPLPQLFGCLGTLGEGMLHHAGCFQFTVPTFPACNLATVRRCSCKLHAPFISRKLIFTHLDMFGGLLERHSLGMC